MELLHYYYFYYYYYYYYLKVVSGGPQRKCEDSATWMHGWCMVGRGGHPGAPSAGRYSSTALVVGLPVDSLLIPLLLFLFLFIY
jgi:hypothetical protein